MAITYYNDANYVNVCTTLRLCRMIKSKKTKIRLKKTKIRLRRQKSDYKDENQTKKTKIRLRRRKSD